MVDNSPPPHKRNKTHSYWNTGDPHEHTHQRTHGRTFWTLHRVKNTVQAGEPGSRQPILAVSNAKPPNTHTHTQLCSPPAKVSTDSRAAHSVGLDLLRTHGHAVAVEDVLQAALGRAPDAVLGGLSGNLCLLDCSLTRQRKNFCGRFGGLGGSGRFWQLCGVSLPGRAAWWWASAGR